MSFLLRFLTRFFLLSNDDKIDTNSFFSRFFFFASKNFPSIVQKISTVNFYANHANSNKHHNFHCALIKDISFSLHDSNSHHTPQNYRLRKKENFLFLSFSILLFSAFELSHFHEIIVLWRLESFRSVIKVDK